MNKNNYLDIYKNMLRIRLVEEEIAKRYSEQNMVPCPSFHWSRSNRFMNNLNKEDKNILNT